MRFSLIIGIIIVLMSGCARFGRPSASVSISKSVSSGEQSVSSPALAVFSTSGELVDTLYMGMIALGDGSITGDVGCGDSRVVVSVSLSPSQSMTTEAQIRTSLNFLFAADNPYGESGLYNTLAQSDNLTVSDIVVDGDTITVFITGQMRSGGVCDDPRIIDQLRTTVQENVDQSTILFFINGVSIDTYFHG